MAKKRKNNNKNYNNNVAYKKKPSKAKKWAIGIVSTLLILATAGGVTAGVFAMHPELKPTKPATKVEQSVPFVEDYFGQFGHDKSYIYDNLSDVNSNWIIKSNNEELLNINTNLPSGGFDFNKLFRLVSNNDNLTDSDYVINSITINNKSLTLTNESRLNFYLKDRYVYTFEYNTSSGNRLNFICQDVLGIKNSPDYDSFIKEVPSAKDLVIEIDFTIKPVQTPAQPTV